MNYNFSSIATLVFVTLAIIIAFGVIFALPVMLLWNGCLVPAIPGLQEVGWLQSWGLLILSNILFKTVLSKKD